MPALGKIFIGAAEADFLGRRFARLLHKVIAHIGHVFDTPSPLKVIATEAACHDVLPG